MAGRVGRGEKPLRRLSRGLPVRTWPPTGAAHCRIDDVPLLPEWNSPWLWSRARRARPLPGGRVGRRRSRPAGENVLAIEVAGYNVNSYYLLDQPAFLQAELTCGDDVLAATGSVKNSFEAMILPERVKKVQRYSFQRPFSEIYRPEPGYDQWRTEPALRLPAVQTIRWPRSISFRAMCRILNSLCGSPFGSSLRAKWKPDSNLKSYGRIDP